MTLSSSFAHLDFPLATTSAALNALCTVLLIAGRVAIARGARAIHQRLMVGAFVVSAAFLGSYLTRVVLVGPRRYEGPHRSVYLAILGSHTVLAVAVPFLAVTALFLAYKGRLDRHRRVARVALPIWLYVSLTGVVVYWMLFHSAG